MAQVENRYFCCEQCDLRFLDPQMHLGSKAEKERYLLHNNDVTDVRYQNFVRPLFEELTERVRPPARGLDYGAGPGPVLTEMFRTSGFNIELYDPFFWPDTSVFKQKYDFVFASEVVEHFFEPYLEFERLHQLLQPHGWLGVMTALYTPSIDFATWYYRKDPTHVVFYSEKTLHWIADTFHFSNLHITKNRVALFQE